MLHPKVPDWLFFIILVAVATLIFLASRTSGYDMFSSVFFSFATAWATSRIIQNFCLVLRQNETLWTFDGDRMRRARPGLYWRDNVHIIRQRMGTRWTQGSLREGIAQLAWYVEFQESPDAESVSTYARWVKDLKATRYSWEASKYIWQTSQRDDLPFRVTLA